MSPGVQFIGMRQAYGTKGMTEGIQGGGISEWWFIIIGGNDVAEGFGAYIAGAAAGGKAGVFGVGIN